MKVVRTPLGFRLIAAAMTLCLPVAWLEALIVTSSTSLKISLRQQEIAGGVIAIFLLIMAWGVLRGRQLLWWIYLSAGGAWFLATIYTALRTQNPSLGFFSIFLGFFWVVFALWHHVENEGSFFNPHIKWYQGMPMPVTGLQCEVTYGENTYAARVARLDDQGTFIFSENPTTFQQWPIEKSKEADLRFEFFGESVTCHGQLIKILRNNEGAGYLFHDMTADGRKRLGDFVHRLRGMGYVS